MSHLTDLRNLCLALGLFPEQTSIVMTSHVECFVIFLWQLHVYISKLRLCHDFLSKYEEGAPVKILTIHRVLNLSIKEAVCCKRSGIWLQGFVKKEISRHFVWLYTD